MDFNCEQDDRQVIGVWFPVGADISVFFMAFALLTRRVLLLFSKIQWPGREKITRLLP
jgi:hypothetical protein